MELSWNSINAVTGSVAVVVFVALLIRIRVTFKNGLLSRNKRPPGPPGWPIFGNMLQLGDLPHQTMYKLKSKYGPILWLKLGSVNTMVIQSAAEAAELFKKHDASFCDRWVPETAKVLDFNKGALAFSNYGGYWRALRRLCSMGFMLNKRLNETTDSRRRIIDDMVQWIEEDSIASRDQGGTGEVHLNHFLFTMTFNVVGNLILSKDLLDPKDPDGREFFEALNKMSELSGTPNVADFLPFLKWMDPQGLMRGMVTNCTKPMSIASKFVQERLDKRESGEFHEKKDFLDMLLDYEGDGKDGPARFTLHNVNIAILEMCMAGTETSVNTIEWCLAELLRSPNAFETVRKEIDRVVGLNRKVGESDMENLPYLRAVVKETYRLHPAIPLLFPRNTMKDTDYMGYLIPKGTQVLVNTWAIGRDSNTWDDPMIFKPERFLDSNIEYKGQDYELIPFGSGRRICIGLPLAHRVVHLAVATLVQVFDWGLGNGVRSEDVDADETLGIILRKKNPLKVIPKRRIYV